MNSFKNTPYLRTRIAAAGLGLIFAVLVESDLLQLIPAFRCESFGCIGLGVVYIGCAVILPVIFAIATALIAKTEKRRHFFVSLGLGYLAIIVAGFILYGLNEWKVQQGFKEAAQACREYPQLCPEEIPAAPASR